MRDHAEGGVVGEVLLIALGLVLAGAFVVWFGHGATQQPPPRSIGLDRDSSSTSTTASYVITSIAAKGLRWSGLTVKLDGLAPTYDSTLSATPSWCVATGGGTCVATGSWAPDSTSVVAGQVVRIHDSALSGKTFEMSDNAAGALVAAQKLP